MKFLANLLVVTIATIVAVGLLEVAVRALGLADHLVTDPAYVEHSAPGVGNSYKPNFSGVVQGPTQLQTNALGMRDRAFPREKPPGTLRIAVMGDSYAFGQGVAMDAAFPKVIERILAERRHDARIEVMNFGVQGYSIGQAVSRFIADAADFSPDIAVLAVITDDLDPTRAQTVVDKYGYLTKSVGGEGEWKAWLRKSHTAYLLKGIAYALMQRAQGQGKNDSQSGDVGQALQADRTAILEREVVRFIEATSKVGAVPVFALVDFERTEATDAVVRLVRARFPALTVIDCPPQFAGRPASEFAVPRDSHPNAEAHRIIARTIVDRLLEPPLREMLMKAEPASH